MRVYGHGTMGSSTPKSARRWTEQTLSDGRGGTPLGDPAEDALAFATAGLPAREQARAHDRSIRGVGQAGAGRRPGGAAQAATQRQTALRAPQGRARL